MRIGGAASLKHLPDIAQRGEVPAPYAIGNEVAAFRFAAQGRYLNTVAEDQLAGIGQGDRIVVGEGHCCTPRRRTLPVRGNDRRVDYCVH